MDTYNSGCSDEATNQKKEEDSKVEEYVPGSVLVKAECESGEE